MRDSEAEEVQGRRHRRIGEFIDALGQGPGRGELLEGRLVTFRIRFSTEADPSTLLVVRCEAKDGPRIAFVGAYRAADAILAWRARSGAQGMKWREDVPWEQRG